MKIQPVILCGGSGTRLWPASRSRYPKQFMRLGNGGTLFAETLSRLDGLPTEEPIVVSSEACRFYASRAMQEAGRFGTILLEPESRSTAPAIALAAFAALEEKKQDAAKAHGEADSLRGKSGQAPGKDALLLVLPSDHRFSHPARFRAAVELAIAPARSGLLVTFGVEPSRPETGYGYIQRGEAVGEGVFKVAAFYEKPSLERASAMLEQGGFDWNAGIFFFRASAYLDELKDFDPDIWQAAREAWEGRRLEHGFVRVGEAFCRASSVSVDCAVMERTSRAAVVPVDCGWSDLGSWEAFYEAADKDADGNVCEGDVLTENASSCYLRSSGRLIAALDVRDIAVVETRDAILVADRRRTQEVKRVVEKLKQERRAEADGHLREFRPWGSYETLALDQRFQVKRIVVDPGEENSLQLHYHRAEHWVVVSGTAEVTVGDSVTLLSENESVYIPLGARHRIRNPGNIPLVFIEVQSGAYLGEDDIVRLQDNYGRAEGVV